MPTLTRRRDRNAGQESRLIYCGDVHVGTIGLPIGNPIDSDPWQWRCGFYPGSRPGVCTSGTAARFDQGRVLFLAVWAVFLSKRTDADFEKWREERARTARKSAIWRCGERPTPLRNGSPQP